MSDVGVSQTLVIGHLWQSVALAAVLALVLVLGKRMRGSTRYGLGAAAFVASLALPLAAFIPGETIVASLLQQLNAPVALQANETTRMEVTAPMAAAPAPAAAPAAAVPPPAAGEASLVLAVAPAAAPAAPAAPALPAVKVVTETQPVSLFTVPELKLPDLGWPLLAIWLTISTFLIARTVRDLLAVERLVARARPADLPPALQARMRGVRVVVSPEAPGPMAAGLLKPCIVLPESIALASPGMAGLLEHEHAHIRRHDMLAALGQRIVLALLWWSPALHWLSRRIDEEREVACDEAAVDRTGDAKAFARSLTKQAENQLWVRAPRLAVGAIGPRSHFGRRVKRLIDIAKTGGTPAKYSGRLAFSGLVLAVAVAAMVTPRFTAEAQPPAADENVSTAEAQDRARAKGRTVIALDGGGSHDHDLAQEAHDFAAIGAEIEALMTELGPELEGLLADLTPELQAELGALSVEMSALGVDLSSLVGQEVLAELPSIMLDVRLALEEAGIDADNMEAWQDFENVDMEEVRRALDEAHEEIRASLGPELQAEIRAALAEARSELADHRGEIAAAMSESRLGLDIARQALAAARDEMAAARERGDLTISGPNGGDIGMDIERSVLDALRSVGIPVDGRGKAHPLPGQKLFDAADDCDINQLNKLIGEEKISVNTMVPGRGTALMAAAESNCTDAARLLINAGADLNLGFPGEGTPLSQAVENGATEIVRLLVNRGADLGASVPGRKTPLAAAASEGDLAMVKLLVEAGASVNQKSVTAGNRTPLAEAERHGNDEIAAYLRSKGASVQ